MLALALMLAAQTAPAAETPAPAMEAPARFTNQARAGDLFLLQLWSSNPTEFLEAWNRPTPPNLRTTTRIERNRPITAFVIFAGCRADAAGNCNLSGSIEFRDPDGGIYGQHDNISFWSGPAIAGYNLRLSPVGPALRVEDGEKLGTYTVRITVTDRNADVTAITEERLTVIEAGS